MDAMLAEHGTTLMEMTSSALLSQARIDLARRGRNRERAICNAQRRERKKANPFDEQAMERYERYGFQPADIRNAQHPADVLAAALKALKQGRQPVKPLGRALLYTSAATLEQALKLATQET